MENTKVVHNKELNKRVFVREIKDIFGLTQLTGNDESLNRWVIAPDINRPGLELSGYRGDIELKRVVVIGNKEQNYIATLDYDTQYERFSFLTDSYTPCIIITGGAAIPESLRNVANGKNFPVFSFPDKTYVLTTEITAFLNEKLSPVKQIHGVMMNIYGIGVLITGESGMGKSELALDLIKRGHILVADDVVEYSRVHNDIVCRAPENIKRMLEIRGLGILDVSLMFGAQSYLDKTDLQFAIRLVTPETYRQNNTDRLEPTELRMEFFDISKDVLEIPVTRGKNMSPIIETAVTNFILKKNGVDTNERFKESIKELILSKMRKN